MQNTDCSLRQGAGGTEFARFGSRTCFFFDTRFDASGVLSDSGGFSADRSLRQGAGGREFARLGSRTWFLR